MSGACMFSESNHDLNSDTDKDNRHLITLHAFPGCIHRVAEAKRDVGISTNRGLAPPTIQGSA